jgi:bifunctional non-homologous end joining protein LigD
VTPAESLAIELGAPRGEVEGRRLTPMLCEREEGGARVLDRAGWLYELKLDGVRIVADKRGDDVFLTYRKSRDATASYPEVVDALRGLGEGRVVLDGEIVAFDDEGRPDFEKLGTRIQVATRDARKAAARVPVAYVLFDVLAIGDRDLRSFPIEARKEILERVVAPVAGSSGGVVRVAPTFERGTELFELCREKRLEGVVAKRLGSTYRAGERNPDWLKIKCELDADFVVVGWAEGEGRRSLLGALDLAAWEDGRFVIRGAVGSGLDDDMIEMLLDRLKAIEVPQPMAHGKWNAKKVRHYVKPEIVVSVKYMGFSSDGALRHPVFRGVRPDLAPEECTVSPAAVGRVEGTTERRRLHVTNPEKAIAPDGTTKSALCKYYEAVAGALLPHVAGRPAVLLATEAAPRPLWPLPKWTPSWVRTTVLPGGGGKESRGVVIEHVDALIFAAESGCGSLLVMPLHEDAPGKVDFVALRSTPKGALALRALALRASLPSRAKTAGDGAVDVLVSVGRAPIEVADALGALLARLAAEESGETVEVQAAAVAPWALALDANGRLAPSVPVSDEEIGATFSREDAIARAASGEDPVAAMFDEEVDLAHAVAVIERAVASR